MDNLKLKENGTSFSKEILSGITVFLTMSYILFVNPLIGSAAGAPVAGVFVATALTSAICTVFMALFSRTPFAMAPGMGLNTFLAYTVCGHHGFHWKEAMAVAFLAGVGHVLIMATGLRKSLINAMPSYLKMAAGVGLGLFIAYIGLKNAGLLAYTTQAGQYEILASGAVVGSSATVPGINQAITGHQLIAVLGLVIMLILMALEKKTGDTYAALTVGIIAATFIGIPLKVTELSGLRLIDPDMILEIKQVALSFFGRPGLLSLLDDGPKLLTAISLVLILLLTNVMDSIGTILGIGRINGSELFDRRDMEMFEARGCTSKLDRALVANSLGGAVSALLGTSPATTYIESVTGIVTGGRTGLTGLVASLMFVLCLPFGNFFHIVPAAAVAPALVIAGGFMISLAVRIDWLNFEESFPAFMTILFIPLTYGVVYGIAAGVLTHVVIQVALGRKQAVHPLLYLIAAIFIAMTGAAAWTDF